MHLEIKIPINSIEDAVDFIEDKDGMTALALKTSAEKFCEQVGQDKTYIFSELKIADELKNDKEFLALLSETANSRMDDFVENLSIGKKFDKDSVFISSEDFETVGGRAGRIQKGLEKILEL